MEGLGPQPGPEGQLGNGQVRNRGQGWPCRQEAVPEHGPVAELDVVSRCRGPVDWREKHLSTEETREKR